ncbi:hypothetical protein H1S01_18270 [Heliobacterium chlorum]|uniref:Uncharacterized protein n=1 Tax=Heliobacterium chlorum TaxID=2698 RepID=A0ABR7T6M6_HELCL|nr:hypothetical protein [Heliobacterium chlorum]MBC9786404.1 hypothetical protein [Heliobacterium chlorum]
MAFAYRDKIGILRIVDEPIPDYRGAIVDFPHKDKYPLILINGQYVSIIDMGNGDIFIGSNGRMYRMATEEEKELLAPVHKAIGE